MEKDFLQIGNYIINDYRYLELKNYIAHSNISCYDHSYSVALSCYKFAIKHGVNCNIDDLVIGALLHDYYLYDWHSKDNGIRLHGYKHHKYAYNNALRDFNINKKQGSIIYSHMFPLTFWTIPLSKEAFIVSMFDKYVAVKEIFGKRK